MRTRYEVDKPILRATLRMYGQGQVKQRRWIGRQLAAYMRREGWAATDARAYLRMVNQAIGEVVRGS